MSLGPGDHQRDVESEGGRRIYLVHVPERSDSNRAAPLIMVLHGGGGSAHFAHRVHNWIALAEREGCAILFPEATPEDPSVPPGVRENPRIWNDGSRRSAVARRNVDDIGYLSAVLDDVQANLPVDPNRVFVTGFSNGASMTFRVGVEMSDRVAAVAPVAGHLCLTDPRPACKRSMLYIIGRADPINPPEGGPTLNPWGARRNRPAIMDSIHTWVDMIGASRQPTLVHEQEGVRFTRYGPGTSGCEVHLYLVEGQGHEWPGAQRTLPAFVSGPQTQKLNATQVIWDFFASR